MANWTFDPSQYEERRFELIPVGDYRARVKDVTEKTFRSGNNPVPRMERNLMEVGCREDDWVG